MSFLSGIGQVLGAVTDAMVQDAHARIADAEAKGEAAPADAQAIVSGGVHGAISDAAGSALGGAAETLGGLAGNLLNPADGSAGIGGMLDGLLEHLDPPPVPAEVDVTTAHADAAPANEVVATADPHVADASAAEPAPVPTVVVPEISLFVDQFHNLSPEAIAHVAELVASHAEPAPAEAHADADTQPSQNWFDVRPAESHAEESGPGRLVGAVREGGAEIQPAAAEQVQQQVVVVQADVSATTDPHNDHSSVTDAHPDTHPDTHETAHAEEVADDHSADHTEAPVEAAHVEPAADAHADAGTHTE